MTDTVRPATGDTVNAAKLELLRRRMAGAVPGADSAEPAIPQVSSSLRVPASPAQRGLWVLDSYLEGSALYSANEAMWLVGDLHVGALRIAIDSLVARHESLRTIFVGEDAPVQLVRPAHAASLRVLSLAGNDLAPRRERALELASDEVAAPFDLRDGPLFRALLVPVAVDEHLLVLNLHHIVTDGQSFDIIARDLAECYEAALHQHAPRLVDLPLTYRDFAAWQLGRLTHEREREQLTFWREALAGVAPVLDLPTDRPRPPRQSHRGAAVTSRLRPGAADGVRRLAAANGATVFTVLLTAWQVLLYRYTGQSRFAIGSLIAGRNHVGADALDDVVGLFATTVALPADLGDRPRFADLLARTQRTVTGAISNQDVTFDRVVEELAPARDLSRNPVFQTIYQHMDAGENAWDLPGLEVRRAELGTATTKVDLGLFSTDQSAQGITIDLSYATDLFDPSTAQRIVDHYCQLVGSVVADPNGLVDTLELLSAVETEQITDGWNDTASAYPTDRCLHELFEEQVARAPDAVAVVGPDGTVSYRELDARANQLAHRLRQLGVGPEVMVGVCLRHCVDLFVGLLAILKAGGAYVPLDPEHPADRLSYVVHDAGALLVLTRQADRDPVADCGVRLLCLDSDWASECAHQSTRAPEPTAHSDNLVYSIYTSGSTGRPKGVLITHRSLNNYLVWAVRGYGLDGASGAPMLGSVAFDLSIPNFFLPFIGGRDVTLLPEDRGLEALAELLRRPGDFSLLKITPSHLDMLRSQLDGADGLVSSVRTFVVGADEVKPETVAAWRRIAPDARLINEYGPTETVVGCSVYEIPDDGTARSTVSIGRPIANTQMYVLDERLRPVPPGVIGELYIGGDGVARGYRNRPALSAAKFLPDPYSGTPGARFYRTGDRARFRPDGNLEFLGRIDHQVKIRGYRVELGEVETALLTHPAVTEAVVAAREDEPGRRRLVGYVVPSAADRPEPVQVRDFLRRMLPEYLVPAVIVVLDRLPLSAGGKVDRRLLPAPTGDRTDTTEEFVAPRAGTEQVLARCWAEALGVERIGAHDNFFGLGGDSLLALKVVSLAVRTGLAVTPNMIFQWQTVAELAAAVSIAAPTEPVVRVLPSHDGDVGLTPVQRRFLESSVDRAAHVALELVEADWSPSPNEVAGLLARLIERHGALRLRLGHTPEGEPRQWIADHESSALLTVIDLGRASEPELADATRRAAQQVTAGIDLRTGPLLRAALLRTGAGRCRLVLAIHHMATDGMSWRIILDDLRTGWQQLRRGETPELPAASASLADWTNALTELAASTRIRAELDFWVAQDAVAELPIDIATGPNSASSTRTVVERVSSARTAAWLATASRDRGWQSHQLLGALASAVTEYTGANAMTVEVSGHGRHGELAGLDLSRTVGWLATRYPLRLTVPRTDRSIAEPAAQSAAVPGHGLGYGLLRHLGPDPAVRRQLARQPRPPIAFNHLGRYSAGDTGDTAGWRWLVDTPELVAADDDREHLLELVSAIVDGELILTWVFSVNRHAESTVRGLARAHLRHLLG